MFSGLALSVREVDFIGWYRKERIAAAVLTQGSGRAGAGRRPCASANG